MNSNIGLGLPAVFGLKNISFQFILKNNRIYMRILNIAEIEHIFKYIELKMDFVVDGVTFKIFLCKTHRQGKKIKRKYEFP